MIDDFGYNGGIPILEDSNMATLREQLCSQIHRLYNDNTGHYPSFNYDEMTDDELEDLLSDIEDENESITSFGFDIATYVAFKERIVDTMELCNCEFSQALDYCMDADGYDLDNIDQYFEDMGIGDTMYLALRGELIYS